MRLKINGQDVDVVLENEKTVGDILASFEAEAAKNEATTIGITLNGKKIPPDDFEQILQKDLQDDTELDLHIVTKKDVAASFAAIAERFSALNTQLADVPVFLQSGKEKEAVGIIAELATQFNEFCHVATLSALFPELYESIRIEGNDLNTFFKEFSPILADFEHAMKEKDTVTLGDLSEYEISPRLQVIAEAIAHID